MFSRLGEMSYSESETKTSEFCSNLPYFYKQNVEDLVTSNTGTCPRKLDNVPILPTRENIGQSTYRTLRTVLFRILSRNLGLEK